MNGQNSEIAMRLRGLRELLEISEDEMASVCKVTKNEYLAYETGESHIPITNLKDIAKKYKVELTALLVGEEPNMKSYFLTRAGHGPAIERTKSFDYEALAAGFVGREAEPFIVTVKPEIDEKTMSLNTHSGQEFNYVLDGKLLLSVGGHELILTKGDSLYFDGNQPHGMKALDGGEARFLAIII